MRKGTNIETRDWYALYASGYFPSEMLSVKRVDETNNVQSTSAGISGQIGVTVNGEPDSSRFGVSGASSGKSVMIACTGGSVSAYGRTGWRTGAHPERLLAEEVGVPGPCPETAGDEPALRIARRPADACAGPVVLRVHAGVLVRLEGILLVVRDELHRDVGKGERAEDVVGCAELCGLLEGGNVGGDA